MIILLKSFILVVFILHMVQWLFFMIMFIQNIYDYKGNKFTKKEIKYIILGICLYKQMYEAYKNAEE